MRTTSYGDGIFSQGGLPAYGYGRQVTAYGDGALGGCSSCSASAGVGAVDPLLLTQSAAAAMQRMGLMPVTAMQTTQPSLASKIFIYGGIAAGVGAIAYLAFFRKKKSYSANARRAAAPKSWYLFFYEPRAQVGPGKGPKEYQGPFASKAFAQSAQQAEIAKYGKPSRGYRYVIKQLSDAQFERLWGVPPSFSGGY